MSSQLVSASPAVIELPKLAADRIGQEWVEYIFSCLTIKYGDAFLGQYRTLKVSALHADWAKELAGFVGKEAAFDYALANLPEKPCNVIQFKALCKQWRPSVNDREVVALLGNSNKGPSEGAARFRRWRERTNIRPDGDSLEPARQLMRRELAGEPILLVQREYWRAALRRELRHQTGIDVGRKFDLGELKLALDGYAETMRKAAQHASPEADASEVPDERG
jgi:hypothetical protein